MNKDTNQQPKSQPEKKEQPTNSPTKNADPKTQAPAQNLPAGDSKTKNPAPSNNQPAGDKKLGIITIENYDPSKDLRINSPRSLEAMKYHGVKMEELKSLVIEEPDKKFELSNQEVKEDFYKQWQVKNKIHYESLKKKIAEKRKEIILEEEEEKKKKLKFDIYLKDQAKQLEEQKKNAKVEYEEKMKKRQDDLKRIEEIIKNSRPAEESKTSRKEKSLAKSADKKDALKPTATNPKDKKQPASPTKVANSQVQPPVNPTEPPKDGKKRPKSSSAKEAKKPIILDEEVKESGLFGYFDKSAKHKELLELGLKDKAKVELKKEKERIRGMMENKKKEILELAQKRTQSAYKTQNTFENAKTRRIELLTELTRDPVQVMKEKQQKEMESMMNFEIALQVAFLDS
jgi:hypothetical protein